MTQGLEINAFRLNTGGGFIVSNNAGVWMWDGAQCVRLIADHAGEEGAR